MEIQSKSIYDTKEAARTLLKEITSNDKLAKVIAFYGNLGSGKTTFIQILGQELGIKENILSPTFVIEKIYEITKYSDFNYLIHIDTYRIEKSDELINLGWEDIIKEPKNLIVIEWADKIEDLLPNDTLRIYLEFIDESSRRIKW